MPHYSMLRTRLAALACMFPNDSQGETYRALFDDFLASNEFGLAFEVLCDCFLEPEARALTDSELAEIAALRSVMNIDDQYFLRLRDKRRHSQDLGSQ
jgi:hypothetical protein